MKRQVAILAVGMLIGLALRSGGQEGQAVPAPRLDDEAVAELQRLLELDDQLTEDPRWSKGKTTLDWLLLEADHYSLYVQCRGFEEVCRRAMEAHPGSLAFLYQFVSARQMHDLSLSLVYGHELGRRGLAELAGNSGSHYDRLNATINAEWMADFQTLVDLRQ